MINLNEHIVDSNSKLSVQSRGLNYGDAVFETIKIAHGKILFWEDHYFRLMASMRIMRMEIPMHFTMEFLQAQIQKTLKANNLQQASVRAKLLVQRNEGGLYLPQGNSVNFIITAQKVNQDFYLVNDGFYQIDLFKDYYIAPTLLSTLKTNNKAINVVGSIYAKENKLHNCLLLNTNKQVVEALNGNVFVVKGQDIKTPPIADGCLNGIMRKQLVDLVKLMPEYNLIEASVSPFELQKADEIFITNVITGIQPVSKYRKKTYANKVSKNLLKKLNVKLRLGNTGQI